MTTKTQTQNTSSSSAVKRSIVTLSEFNPTRENVKIVDVKKNANGLGEFGSIKYNNSSLELAITGLVTPFGASKVVLKDKEGKVTNANSKPKYTLTFSLPPDSPAFAKISQMDQAIKDVISTHDYQAFKTTKNGQLSEEMIEEKYNPSLKAGTKDEKDGKPKYDNSLFTTSLVDENKSQSLLTYFFDKDKNPLKISYEENVFDGNVEVENELYINKVCPPSSLCDVLISPSIWVVDKKFGVKWQVRQVIVYPAPLRQIGVCLLTDESDPSNTDHDVSRYVDTNEHTSEHHDHEESLVNDPTMCD